MSTINIIQNLAQIKERLARPTDLQEFLECLDFILAMICVRMGHSTCNFKSLRHFMISYSNGLFIAHRRNSKILTFLTSAYTPDPFYNLQTASDWAESMQSQIADIKLVLNRAGLADKREVLRYMKIITSPVAAAYLGITEKMLANLKNWESCNLGEQYAGGHCHSLEELNLIAKNLQWVCDWEYTNKPAHTAVDSSVLDYVIHVDEAIAMAITDTTAAELRGLVSMTENTRRPYRLADLEKVRVAKLHAAA